MMQIDIHDVGHGHCALVTAPDGSRIMIDCGSNPERAWWPSIHYYGQYIDLLVLQNLDEDHVDDLVDLWRNVRLGGIVTNPTISAGALEAMKRQHGMNRGVRFVHTLLSKFRPGLVVGALPLSRGGGASATAAWNSYGADHIDTNNLSVATFFQYGSFTILFTGDLEKEGWNSLLGNSEFASRLRTVNVLVASHHGRESGCCERAFELMRPDVVVFSDDDVKYETQDTIGWYRARTKGIPDLSKQPSYIGQSAVRRVLTTRRDGTLRFVVEPSGNYTVTGQRDLGTHFLPTPLPTGMRYLGSDNLRGLGTLSSYLKE